VVSIDPVLLLVQLGTFLVAVFLLWRFMWKPLVKFMDTRRQAVAQDIETARKNREQAEQLHAQVNQRLSEIDAETRRLLQQATDESKRTREQILQEAQAEARRLLDSAGRQIAEERTRAIRDLRAETVALSLLIAEKALKQSVDADVQHRLVDEFVTELKRGE
jgi:F-type H+-transporting ATPase subunit b